MRRHDEKAHEAIVFGMALALLILIVYSAMLYGGKGQRLYPTSQGRGSIAGTPVRTPANIQPDSK